MNHSAEVPKWLEESPQGESSGPFEE